MKAKLVSPAFAYTDAIARRTARLSLSALAHRIVATVRLWRRRQRDRCALARFAELDERALADIGLARADVEFLVNKPFWRK